MRPSLAHMIGQVRSLSLFVREGSPHLVFRLEAAEKIELTDPGFRGLLKTIYQALKADRETRESEVVDLWALDLWEYNREEYEHFAEHPEEFSGFSQCGIARILSHIAVTLDFGGPDYLFAMYNVAQQVIDISGEIAREEYEVFLEALPF